MLRISITRHILPNAYEQARHLRLSIPGSAALRLYLRGDGEIRTLDPLLARQVLSQLSYTPIPGTKVFLFAPSGLKWTRTTDLTLIRRAL